MPKPHTVTEPGPLLARCFDVWPECRKTQVRSWLKHQAITVNGRPVTQFDHPLQAGDVVAVRQDRFAAPRTTVGAGIRIFYEDAEIVVMEKPSGLLSIASESEPERTAYQALTDHVRRGNPLSRNRVWIVHRLDRETSGLMVFARTPEAKETLQGNWDAAEKTYEALVAGTPNPPEGTFDSHLDERNPFKVFSARPSEHTRHAITHYRVLKRGGGRSLVELRLETGRRHQIRVQLADAGCPILGDPKYGRDGRGARRLALHATRLAFPHPRTGQRMEFQSPLPKDLERLIPRG